MKMRAALCLNAIALASRLAMACPCDNPLDATSAQYLAVENLVNQQYAQTGLAPPNDKPFPTISGQSAAYAVSATPGIENHYLALSKDGVNAVLANVIQGNIALPASGIVGFEMRVNRFPRKFMTKAGDNMLYVMAGSGLGYRFRLGLMDVMNGAYSFYGTEYNGVFTANSMFATAQPVALPLGSDFRLGIYFNMSTRQVGYTVNGLDRGYVPDAIPANVSDITLLMGGDTNVPAGDVTIGSTVQGTLITKAASFTQPFPAGTVDICGTPVN